MKKRIRVITLLLCGMLFTSCAQGGVSKTKENVPVEPVEITISVYKPQQLLDTIVAMYMDNHPGVTVTVNNFFDNRKTIVNAETGIVEGVVTPDDYTLENYARYLNTLLMSGNADDIIIFQDIPESQYARMGALADLAPYIARDSSINEDTFFMNVLDAAKDAGGRMYRLPVLADVGTLYHFNKALTENTGIAWDTDKTYVTYAEMFAYAKQVCAASTLADTYLTYEDSGAQLAVGLIQDRYSEFVNLANREAHFDSPAFRTLLQSVYDDYHAAALVPLDEQDVEYYMPYLQSTTTMRSAGASINNPDLLYNIMPLANADGQVGSSALRAAVTTNSPNKDTAWDFLRFMLTDEVQTLPSLYSPGISRTAFPVYVENFCNGMRESSGGALNYPPDSMVEVLSEWLLRINGFAETDVIVNALIYNEMCLLFEDAQSIEETVRNLQYKCDMHLNQ